MSLDMPHRPGCTRGPYCDCDPPEPDPNDPIDDGYDFDAIYERVANAELLANLRPAHVDHRLAAEVGGHPVILTGIAAELANAANTLDTVTAERDALAAEAERLRLALGSVLRYADAHRISRPAEHGHDCFELWCIERDHARIYLDGQEDTDG